MAERNLITSPDFTAIIKTGTEDDHALLMASIFRTCKMETLEEFDEFVEKERAKLVSRNAEDEKLIKLTDEEEEPLNKSEENQEEEKETGDKEEEKEQDITEKYKDSIDDRVFVCMGKANDESGKRNTWVMTIDRRFETVTFWEPK